MLCLIPWVEARRKRREKEEALNKEQDVTQRMMEPEKAEPEKVEQEARRRTSESVL